MPSLLIDMSIIIININIIITAVNPLPIVILTNHHSSIMLIKVREKKKK